MSERGKQINYFIKTRKDREKEGRRESQRGLFETRELEMEYLAQKAKDSIKYFTVEELDAEIARGRARRKSRA